MPSPGFKVFNLEDVAFQLSDKGEKVGNDALMASGELSAITPNHRHPPGTFIVEDAALGKFYLANNVTNGDRNTGASVSALETADADWQSTVYTVTVDGGQALPDITLGAGDDTDAEVVIALNANLPFRSECIADVDAGVVRIRTLEAGKHKTLKVLTDLATAYGALGVEAIGADADYRITRGYAELKDIDAVAQDYRVPTLESGHFDLSVLNGSTVEAQATLNRRGSDFE